ncbi:OmpP1/FadL family transporter [Desulfonatronovibrio hydrogenovorans]|uniref:OmpP1/FadL family transporter n=1 Tax=Desulfonatronovibrio hydrogenovorans TaxID=53245 RepID=UPI000491DE96|nr:OmpP1/FadL family transporter [Desulfonatronovibrio hydrogenovorans]
MNFKTLALALVLVVFVQVESVNAAGFALYEWGARGTAMGGTMIGRADDPSAVAYNPAGITQLEGTQTMVGFSVVAPQGKIDTPGETTKIKSNYWIPPHAFLTHQLTDQAWLGLGLYTRFGLGTEFPDDWEGRYNNIFTRVRSFSFNPNIAYKVTDTLSIALGAEVMWFDFYQKKDVPFIDGDIRARLDGDSYGVGGNIAIHYKPNDMWAFGLTYKSRVKQTIKGDAKFNQTPFANMLGQFENTSAKGDITLPDSFGLGILFRPHERLSLEGNAIYTLWSTYDKLKIDYGKPLTPGQSNERKTVSTDKKWKDVWRFQLGAEYNLNELIDLRLGYVYDQIPDRDKYADYMTPTNDRHIITTGVGFNWDKASLDLSYSYLWFANRKIDGRADDDVLDSKFKDGRTHLMGISFSYRF